MENWTYSKPAIGYRESGLFAGICYGKNKPVYILGMQVLLRDVAEKTPALHSRRDAVVALHAIQLKCR